MHLALGMTPLSPPFPAYFPLPSVLPPRWHASATAIPVHFESTGFRTWSWNENVCYQSVRPHVPVSLDE